MSNNTKNHKLLQRSIQTIQKLKEKVENLESNSHQPIAIVGMGCRFPKSPDLDQFWNTLSEGVDAISEVPPFRWDIDKYYSEELDTPGKMYTRYGGFIDNPDFFDPHFFGISPREAIEMDPQHRIFLEVSWEAFESAGIVPSRMEKESSEKTNGSQKTGVFVGISTHDYSQIYAQSGDPKDISTYYGTGNAFSAIAGRLSYLMGFQGPAMAVDTACSSSLVAVHLACQSLLSRESDLAIAGGVNLMLSPLLTINFCQARMMAPDGRCKSFDDKANGYVRGEGCGVVILKRLKDAFTDQDNILAVIRSTAVNQDGRSNGLTAPNGPSQEAVIAQALAKAQIHPHEVDYIETHGTGTPLGDPIEVQALVRALCTDRHQEKPLKIGSVKTNIGHLEAAAGIAGLIKTVLALKNKVIPRHLHFSQPNVHIAWENIPVQVVSEKMDWEKSENKRIAGVSSFGFTGTNAHVILEENTQVLESPNKEASTYILPFSAHSPEALSQRALDWSAYLSKTESTLKDIVFSASVGREHLTWRGITLAQTKESVAHILSNFPQEKNPYLQRGEVPKSKLPLVFVFSGHFSSLYRKEQTHSFLRKSPLFAEFLTRCEEKLSRYVSWSLTEEWTKLSEKSGTSEITSVVIFSAQVALAQIWKSWGVYPDAALGHGLGGVSAAYLAKTINLEEALLLLLRSSSSLKNSNQHHAVKINYQKPQFPLYSSVSGTKLRLEDLNEKYWSEQIDQSALFTDAVKLVAQEKFTQFLQLGGDLSLTKQIQLCLSANDSSGEILGNVDPKSNFQEEILLSLGRFYCLGYDIQWKNLYSSGRIVDLPTYPWQRRSYWPDIASLKSVSDKESLLYEINWSLDSQSFPKTLSKSESCYLILDESTGIGEAIESWLKEQNISSRRITEKQGLLATCSEMIEQEVDQKFEILYLAKSIPETDEKEKKKEKETDIVSLKEQRKTCENVLSLAQLLISKYSQRTRLSILTQNVQSVTPQDIPQPAQATLWGMGKSIALECPEIWGGLIDVNHSFQAEDIQSIGQAITYGDHEKLVALRQGKRYTARLKRISEQKEKQKEKFELAKEASYLVTGGTGEVGQEVLRWLVSKGAQSLILISRQAPSPKVQEIIDSFSEKGTQVTIFQVDISQRNDLQEVFEKIQSLPPLKGIFHLAGVLEDALIVNQSWASFSKVFASKVEGSLNLHELSKAMDLDHFVLYSSVASLLGSPGQSSYCAANAFMDALAHYRRSQNLVGTSINWGPWENLGMAAGSKLKKRGVHGLSVHQAHQALEKILLRKLPQAGVLSILWPTFIQGIPEKSRSFFELVSSSESLPKESVRAQSQILAKMHQAIPAERPSILRTYLIQVVRSILRLSPDESIDTEKGLFDLGSDSLTALEIKNLLEVDLQCSLPSTLLFDYPTIEDIQGYLLGILFIESSLPILSKTSPLIEEKMDVPRTNQQTDIAVVGLGCRFPGAKNPQEFWELLEQGRDAIREIPPFRWDKEKYYDPVLQTPGKMYVQEGGFIENIDAFDPEFFGISPREAVNIDPQQRLLLEVSWETLENAGYAPNKLKNSQVGVFIGIGSYDYSSLHTKPNNPELINAYSGTGNSLSIAAGRLSHLLGLQGPSMAIDTACSSSMVALHLACQSLQSNESNMALVGGVNAIVSPETSIFLCQNKALSPENRCKTFDASANGYVRSEGCGVVLLKRLSQAIADGDNVLAVVKGTSINHDGMTSGLTVPNGVAQKDLILQALKKTQISPEKIDYIETHGTGTPLGDPIEARALSEVFQTRQTNDKLLIGSVKTNIGHLEAAAGVAGFIKVVLSLQKKKIPAHLHFKTPSPHIPWDKYALSVVKETMDWPLRHNKRQAGISSFGFSGTNVHAIVEEAPLQDATPRVSEKPYVFTLSARSKESLFELLRLYQNSLPSLCQTHSLADICSTTNMGRKHFRFRMAMVVENAQELRKKIKSTLEGSKVENFYNQSATNRPKFAFLFTGQGSQYSGMGKTLYQKNPLFRENLQACAKILEPILEKPLLDVFFDSEYADLLNQTEYAQPALFALEYSLAQLWLEWVGLPDMLLGHSVGEYVAASLAGVFSLEDGLKLIAKRGQLMQKLPVGGGMAALFTEEKKARQLIEKFSATMDIAAINGPQEVVVSGAKADLQTVLAKCKEQGIRATSLNVSHAFHSPLMEPILEEFYEFAKEISWHSPKLPVLSNLTGTVVPSEKISSPQYWRDHIRGSVRFHDTIENAQAQDCPYFIEIGPQPILTNLLTKTLCVPSLRKRKDDHEQLIQSVAQLYTCGLKINWSKLYRQSRYQKIPLPTYPFARKSYWLKTEEKAKSTPLSTANLTDLQYKVAWQESSFQPKTRSSLPTLQSWVVVAQKENLWAKEIEKRLTQKEQNCIMVWPGEEYHKHSENKFDLDFSSLSDWKQLFACLEEKGICLHKLLYLTNSEKNNSLPTLETLQEAENFGCGSLINLIKVLPVISCDSNPLWVVTQKAQAFLQTKMQLEQSLVWGLSQVIGLEHPEIWGGIVDLESSANIPSFLENVCDPESENKIAYRGEKTYVSRLQRAEKLPLKNISFSASGSYLITGGLGSIGLKVGEWLVKLGARKVILLTRSGFPSRSTWSEHASDNLIGKKIATIQALEKQGAEIIIAKADTSNMAQMKSLFLRLQLKKSLRGIVHAAGVSHIQELSEIDLESLHEVLLSKVSGTWVLHQLTKEISLDFFTLFSSIASVWGSKGLGPYAAANSFLDMFAHFREEQNLPASSINWGPWSGGGMASGEAQTTMHRMGIKSFSPKMIEKFWEQILQTQTPQFTLADVDWKLFKELYAVRTRSSLFAEIISEEKILAQKTAVWSPLLAEKDPQERLEDFILLLQEEFADVLETSPENIDSQQGFFDLGMDSLMAVEFKNRIEEKLGLSLPPTLAFNYPNIQVLAPYLLDRLFAPKEISTLKNDSPEEKPILPRESDFTKSSELKKEEKEEKEDKGLDLDSLLDEIEKISEDSAEQGLLNKKLKE